MLYSSGLLYGARGYLDFSFHDETNYDNELDSQIPLDLYRAGVLRIVERNEETRTITIE